MDSMDASDSRMAVARAEDLPAGEAPLRRGRRVAVRVVGVLALVAFNFMLVFVVTDAQGRLGGTQNLEPPGSAEARYGAAHPGEAVHLVGGVAALAMGIGGLTGLALRPQRAGSATHVGLAAIGWLLVSAVVGDPDNHGGQAAPVDLAFVLLAAPALATACVAAPWRVWRGGIRRPELLVIALVGLPWLWWGFRQALIQRNTWPPLADPHHQAHWFVMSLAAVLVVLLAAGGALPGRGWRVATVTSGAAAIGLGAASLADQQAASALHPAWAAAGILWGLLVLGLTWRARRDAAAP
jgi:hypothetical protein